MIDYDYMQDSKDVKKITLYVDVGNIEPEFKKDYESSDDEEWENDTNKWEEINLNKSLIIFKLSRN